MKKVLKGIAIALLVIAALFFVPRIVMWYRITNLPATPSAKNITDFSLADEDTYEISEGNVTVQIPTYYASTNMRDYSMVMCDGHLKNRRLIIIYQPFSSVADQIVPGYSQKFNESLRKYEEEKPKYPWTLLFDVPEDVFDAITCVFLASKDDYNFWDFTGAIELEYYLRLRQDVIDENLAIDAIYERDNIRAIIAEDPNSAGTYVAMIIPKNNAENTHAFVIETPDPDDVIKLLNTYELNNFGF